MRKTGILAMIMAGMLFLLISCSDKQDTENQGLEDSTAALQQPPDQQTTTPTEIAADSLSQESAKLIGNWVFAQGENMVRITYLPNGTFFSESFVSMGRLLAKGTWEFDGTTLTNVPTRFTATDSSDAAALKEVQRLNKWIADDSTAMVGRATVQFDNDNQFTSTGTKGQVSVYHRVRPIEQ
jgi:hypothetical protein